MIYKLLGHFCDYFPCIPGFWTGTSYIEECWDGSFTRAGGQPNDCVNRGGERRPLYS